MNAIRRIAQRRATKACSLNKSIRRLDYSLNDEASMQFAELELTAAHRMGWDGWLYSWYIDSSAVDEPLDR